MTDPVRYDLYGPAFKANPYPTYAAMREQEPVCYHLGMDGEHEIWFITRYADVEAVLRDHKRFVKNYRTTLTSEQRQQLPPDPQLMRMLDQHMLNADGADHTRLRGLINKAFTAQMVNRMQSRVQAIADTLIERVQDQGAMNLIDDYAFPLPIVVIAELLGVPASDQDRFRIWSDAFLTPSFTPEGWAKTEQLMLAFTGYLGEVFAARRAQPKDDLISALIQAEEAGDKLSEEELYAMVILLIVAGHETTVNLIGNATLALLQNPDQLTKLKNNPALMPAAIEEFLRYDGPVERATMRFAAEDVELGGQLIRRGQAVNVVLAGADRDPAQFANPDQLELTRENNRHLGFGFGVHYCVGAPLARMEGRIALDTLLRRLPNLRLTVPVDTLEWRVAPIIRGAQGVPVAWN